MTKAETKAYVTAFAVHANNLPAPRQKIKPCRRARVTWLRTATVDRIEKTH
jgi:hypothetical protein